MMAQDKKCKICGREGREYEICGETHVYCNGHAIDRGFCPYCGGFYGGVDWEEVNLRTYGMCSSCMEEADYDITDDEWDGDELDYG